MMILCQSCLLLPLYTPLMSAELQPSCFSELILDPQNGVDKEMHIFGYEASLVEIQGDRSGLAGLRLPEAQLRHWLAQFLCNLFFQFMVRRVQRDIQSHSVRVMDLHYHRARHGSMLETREHEDI